jgi:hypothetical protein
MLDQIRVRVDELTRQNDITLATRHKITPEFLQVWSQNWKQDPRVIKILSDIEDLTDQVFVK